MRYEITWWQLAMLLVTTQLASLIPYSVTVIGQLPPVRDSWLAASMAAATTAAMAFLAKALSARFPGKTVFEYTRVLLGRYLGTGANLFLIAMFLHWAAISVRQLAFFFDSVVYLRTPELVFSLLFLVLAAVAVREGFEFIGRTAELASVLIVLGLSFLFLAALPLVEFGALRPVLAQGLTPVLRQALTPIGVFGEASVIALLAIPYLNRLRDAPKGLGLGLAVSGVFIVAESVWLIAIFGQELIPLLAFPGFSAARMISIGGLIERLEWLLLILWTGAMGVRLSLLLFGATLGLRHLLPAVPYRRLAVAAATAAILWSRRILPSLTAVLDHFAPETYLLHALPFQLTPVVLLLIAWARRQGGAGGERAGGERGP